MRVCFHSGCHWTARLLLLGVMVFCGLVPSAQAQEARPDSTQNAPARADTTQRDTIPRDSLRRRPPVDTTTADSRQPGPLARPDSLPPDGAPSNAEAPPGAPPGERPTSAEEGVQFSARDSLIIEFSEDGPGDVGTLYGNSEVQHEKATLTAYEVQILFNQNKLRATGPPEGMRADTAGLPRFKRGEGEAFTGSELSFNLETKRGRIVEARTGFQEGYVQGEAVRVEEDSTLFIQGGRYTTCNCPRGETPSYSLRSNKMKVQGKWVYTGPIQLFIYNIPMPFILPFAFLPSTPGRHGGIIPPSYGRDNRLGFYLRDFGYYWPINDYMDLQLTGSVWSRGSWSLSPTFRYKRRYYYNGDLHVDYVRNISGDVVDSDYLNRTNAKIRWSHNQQFVPDGAPNSSSLRANVDLASSTYRNVVSDDFEDNVEQETSSSINFRKRWNDGNQRFVVKLSQRQNLTTGDADVTLPDVSFSQNSIQPFKRERLGPGEEQRWYEKITTSYDGNLDNTFSFTPLGEDELRDRQNLPDSVSSDSLDRPNIAWYEALFSQEKYRRATGDESQRFDFSATHRIPISASFHLPRYDFNLTPNFSYREEWFPSTKRRERRITEPPAPDSGAVPEADTTVVTLNEPGFFAAREFDFGLSSSTTFYGLFPVRVGPLEGLRHTVQPSLSFNYQPNYYADFFGRTRTYTNEEDETVRYDITNGRDIRGSTEQRAVSFRIDNTFETKEVRTDSTGARQEETLRLMTFDARSSYNFAADSLGLSDVRVGTRFPVLQDKFNINARANMTFSPYVFNDEGRRLNRLVVKETGLFPVRLTDFDVTISTNFQGGESQRQQQTGSLNRRAPGIDRSTGGAPQVPDRIPQNPPGRPSIRQGIGQYANFAIPWSLDLRLSYGFTNEAQFEQSRFLFNANFNFNVTPKWKVSGRSGYDFDQGKLTSTRLNITRDFDCWQMAFSWVPFGPRQSYSFNLYVKSSTLRDLLNLRIPRRGIQDRFGGALSRVAGR